MLHFINTFIIIITCNFTLALNQRSLCLCLCLCLGLPRGLHRRSFCPQLVQLGPLFLRLQFILEALSLQVTLGNLLPSAGFMLC